MVLKEKKTKKKIATHCQVWVQSSEKYISELLAGNGRLSYEGIFRFETKCQSLLSQVSPNQLSHRKAFQQEICGLTCSKMVFFTDFRRGIVILSSL